MPLVPSAMGQSLPAPSPKASIAQRLGLTDVEVVYHRPRVREREIWNGLVPYGEVWRTGANYPTFISFSSRVFIEDAPLEAGRYALYTIPNAEHWTIIFSRNTELWGAFGYKPEDDALRVDVRPREADWAESFTIEIMNVEDDSAVLNLRWAEITVPIRLRVEIHEQVLRNVRTKIENGETDWRLFWKGAAYLLEHQRELETALDWIERSTAFERNWMNTWTRAQILATRGDLGAAVEAGSEALEICRKNAPYCAYPKTYAGQIERWATESDH